MEKISNTEVPIKDGVYSATWSGYNISIEPNIVLETNVGVKGINVQVEIVVKDKIAYLK